MDEPQDFETALQATSDDLYAHINAHVAANLTPEQKAAIKAGTHKIEFVEQALFPDEFVLTYQVVPIVRFVED